MKAKQLTLGNDSKELATSEPKYSELSQVEILDSRVLDDEHGRRLYYEIAVWDSAATKADDKQRLDKTGKEKVALNSGIYADGANSFLISYQLTGNRIKEYETRDGLAWHRLDTREFVPVAQAILIEPEPDWERESFTRDLEAEAIECFDRWKQRAIAKDYLATKPDRRGTTLNLQVSASADDATEREDDIAFSATTGVYTCTTQSSQQIIGGTRFNNVSIPPGATIDAAELLCYLYQSGSDNWYADIYGEAVDDALSYATVADVAMRPRTESFGSIATDSLGVGFASVPVTSPIQEIADRDGFASGNSVNLFTLPKTSPLGKDAYIFHYDQSSANAPKLDIDYTAASTGGRPRNPLNKPFSGPFGGPVG